MALKQFDCVGEGLLPTCARCARTTSWITITAPTSTSGTGSGHHGRDRTLDYLERRSPSIWKVIKGAEAFLLQRLPKAGGPALPRLPEELTFLHAEDCSRRIRICRASNARRGSCRSTGGLHHRDRLGVEDGSRTRCAPPTTTTGRRRPSRGRPADARPERRHPGLEPGHQAAPRAVVDGDPRHQETLKQQLEITGQPTSSSGRITRRS